MVQKSNRTQRIHQTQIIQSLENIYISPLEICNLTCKYCYTHKTSNTLSNQQILDFIKKYSSFIYKSYSLNLKSIIFCVGEVFLLPNFPKLLNTLINKDIFITIITNGTINRLNEIKKTQNCQILVSFDGPKQIHDQNRGHGNFEKSIKYIKDAQNQGFPVGVMFLITKDSYPYKDSFPFFLSKLLDSNRLNFTYLTDRKMSLTNNQCLDIKLHYPTFPNKNFGCYQLSLQSNGHITGCCESSLPFGTITDQPQTYISKFTNSFSKCLTCTMNSKCNGCCDPDYFCHYSQEFHQPCQSIVKSFNPT